MSWTPSPQNLQNILFTIHQATPPNAQAQPEVLEKLEQHARISDYIAYLAWILSYMPEEPDSTRAIAGLLLKNCAQSIKSLPLDTKDCVKRAILCAFIDQSSIVRNAAAQAVVNVLGQLTPYHWLECFQQLIHMLDDPTVDRQEAALRVLQHASEDYWDDMDFEINGTYPLQPMLLKLLQLSDHPASAVRSRAIACLSLLIECPSFTAHFDAFFACLSKKVSDEDPSVRQGVNRALGMLLTARPDKLVPVLGNFVDIMLLSLHDECSEVALEAGEFWLQFVEDPELTDHLAPLLAKLVPLLLGCMICEQDDLPLPECHPEDAADPRPPHDREMIVDASFTLSGPRGGLDGQELRDSDEDDADCDDQDWTLRKCAAAALDALAVRFQGQLLRHLRGLDQKFASRDCREMESGILALGAIAQGCSDAIAPHLPELIPYLIGTLSHRNSFVRSTACWTLGRYASWYMPQIVSEEGRNRYVAPCMNGVLSMLFDSNKSIQKVACSTFATLVEAVGAELVRVLKPVLGRLVTAFDFYEETNIPFLYDIIGTIAEAVGQALRNESCVNLVMSPLAKCWDQSANEDDDDLIPLFECLSSVAPALGSAFLPYSVPIFERCCTIVHTSLLQYRQFEQTPSLGRPDKTVLLTAIDMLSSLTRSLGANMGGLISSSSTPLLRLLTICLKHPQEPVWQAACSLMVGDMASHCLDALRPAMPGIMAHLALQLVPEPGPNRVSAAISASQSVGELSLRYGINDREFQQWVDPLTSTLAVLLHQKTPARIRHNAAVSIGKIASMQAQVMAPHFGEFVGRWCQVLGEIHQLYHTKEEKDIAFRGLWSLVRFNPTGIAPDSAFAHFCIAVTQWKYPSRETAQMFRTLFQELENHSPSVWAAKVALLHYPIRASLKQQYGV